MLDERGIQGTLIFVLLSIKLSTLSNSSRFLGSHFSRGLPCRVLLPPCGGDPAQKKERAAAADEGSEQAHAHLPGNGYYDRSTVNAQSDLQLFHTNLRGPAKHRRQIYARETSTRHFFRFRK